jgi:hypothetical protein
MRLAHRRCAHITDLELKGRCRKQTLPACLPRHCLSLCRRADLGFGMLTRRLARPGQGKSGGYRAIIVFKTATRAIFIYGFAKNVRANIAADELDGYRELVQIYLAKSEEDMDSYIATGALTEVIGDDEAN